MPPEARVADTDQDSGSTAARSYTYLTPFGRETYRILVAHENGHWVSRIVTLPNRLWAHPNGREALKFIADTPEEAESVALEAMEEECRRTGRRLAPSSALAPTFIIKVEERDDPPPVSPAAIRRPRRLLV